MTRPHMPATSSWSDGLLERATNTPPLFWKNRSARVPSCEEVQAPPSPRLTQSLQKTSFCPWRPQASPTAIQPPCLLAAPRSDPHGGKQLPLSCFRLLHGP